MRKALRKHCRCHGISGACSLQTCWDKLIDMSLITRHLKFAYLYRTYQVEARNFGTSEKPDLYLSRTSGQTTSLLDNNMSLSLNDHHQGPVSLTSSSLDRFTPNDLIYLFKGPNYCDPQSQIGHPGIQGRVCNIEKTSYWKSSLSGYLEEITPHMNNELRQEGSIGAVGVCGEVCCHRGYKSELVLKVNQCNCRFIFCCRVECESCLSQQLNHQCL